MNNLIESLEGMIKLWGKACLSFPVLANEPDYIAAKNALSAEKRRTVAGLPSDILIGGSLSGTYLNGYLTASYEDLVNLLGKPGNGDGYKVDAEWTLTVRGKVLSIYNYKDGINYNGDEGTPTEEITDWHIGGKGDIAKEIQYLASLLPTATARID